MACCTHDVGHAYDKSAEAVILLAWRFKGVEGGPGQALIQIIANIEHQTATWSFLLTFSTTASNSRFAVDQELEDIECVS